GIDTTAVLREAHSRFPLIPHFEGTYFQCNFGHLNGYSAIYYTYMWSLVIAKDLFSRFRARGSLLDPMEAERYRDRILGRGSEKPAADLVRDFLGREMGFGPFEAWLREAG
ncbi:MAG TPA: M3 family metallopeptidase, partial [Thermoplasmata archaeon]|nr:M3 family metallopeptidase [Thermoplasmata archaeon]